MQHRLRPFGRGRLRAEDLRREYSTDRDAALPRSRDDNQGEISSTGGSVYQRIVRIANHPSVDRPEVPLRDELLQEP
jgi:hypothetical protein